MPACRDELSRGCAGPVPPGANAPVFRAPFTKHGRRGGEPCARVAGTPAPRVTPSPSALPSSSQPHPTAPATGAPRLAWPRRSTAVHRCRYPVATRWLFLPRAIGSQAHLAAQTCCTADAAAPHSSSGRSSTGIARPNPALPAGGRSPRCATTLGVVIGAALPKMALRRATCSGAHWPTWHPPSATSGVGWTRQDRS